MHKWFVVLALFLIILAPVTAQAQGQVRISSVSVDVWPEFDRPAVLVINHISLAADVALPANLVLRIPSQASVNAVAYADETGDLINAEVEKNVEGEWVVLTFITPSATVQIEYYDTLTKDGTARHITYNWAGDYAVDSFSVTFQQPVDVTDVKFNPPIVNSQVGTDNLTYYRSDPVALTAGQAATWSMDYQKATDRLSTSELNVQPAAPLDESSSGRVSISTYYPWIIGGLGIVLIAVGVVVGLTYWRGAGKKPVRKRHESTNEKTQASDEGIYCHQCGKRAQPADIFCRACGVRLRKGD